MKETTVPGHFPVSSKGVEEILPRLERKLGLHNYLLFTHKSLLLDMLLHDIMTRI